MTELPVRMSERFTLVDVIGRGTCSSVFRAHDLLLDRDVAVKIFPVTDDPRIEREVSLLASLDHPALVPVYDVGEVDGRAFVVMALFEGGDLEERIRRDGPLPTTDALLAAASVADALAHIHRSGVLHRDVIPRNVLFDDDGRAHLSDFGVAFVADAPRITDTGIVLGSAPYLAPEQVRGEKVGSTADVYSLGLVLIEALTGVRAFGGTPLEAAEARLTRRPTTPPGLAADVAGLIEGMTADAPDDRPEAGVVCTRLRRAALASEFAPIAVPLIGEAPAALAPIPYLPPLSACSPHTPPTPGTRVGRTTLVLGAATVSIMLAGGALIASTWPVQSVAATAPPGAALAAPALAAPLVLPPSSSAASDGDGRQRSSVDEDRAVRGGGDDRSGDGGDGDAGDGDAGAESVSSSRGDTEAVADRSEPSEPSAARSRSQRSAARPPVATAAPTTTSTAPPTVRSAPSSEPSESTTTSPEATDASPSPESPLSGADDRIGPVPRSADEPGESAEPSSSAGYGDSAGSGDSPGPSGSPDSSGASGDGDDTDDPAGSVSDGTDAADDTGASPTTTTEAAPDRPTGGLRPVLHLLDPATGLLGR